MRRARLDLEDDKVCGTGKSCRWEVDLRLDDKRVERIWRREGLKVPARQPKRRRLWPDDGSCVRLRPERPNHVWAYGFVEDRTRDGRKFRMLNVVDEFTCEALCIRVARKLGAADAVDVLANLFIARGTPAHVRSDNGPEFVAKAVRGWIAGVGAKAAFIEPGGPWENGFVESFNDKLRDEMLDAKAFNTLAMAKVLIEQRRRHYNTALTLVPRIPAAGAGGGHARRAAARSPGSGRVSTAARSRAPLIRSGPPRGGWSLDRLGRRLSDIADMYDKLSFRGIAIYTIQQGLISQMHIGLLGTMSQLYLADLRH